MKITYEGGSKLSFKEKLQIFKMINNCEGDIIVANSGTTFISGDDISTPTMITALLKHSLEDNYINDETLNEIIRVAKLSDEEIQKEADKKLEEIIKTLQEFKDGREHKNNDK